MVTMSGWHLHRHHRGPQFLIDTTNTGWVLLSGHQRIPPLGHQWVLFHGHGQQWDSRKRQIFANDPIELRAISSSVNNAKSDDGLDEWMPPNPAARCPFATQYVTILAKYELPITISEKNAAIKACSPAT
ncbi:HNH endonuclease family protein (plasmid) [Mycobacterium avium subsp. hominissuis]|uniref:hypothetical protein n=1 Tax=Mycobacterium avium TaxID=1764 RepID=UPI00324B38F5